MRDEIQRYPCQFSSTENQSYSYLCTWKIIPTIDLCNIITRSFAKEQTCRLAASRAELLISATGSGIKHCNWIFHGSPPLALIAVCTSSLNHPFSVSACSRKPIIKGDKNADRAATKWSFRPAEKAPWRISDSFGQTAAWHSWSIRVYRDWGQRRGVSRVQARCCGLARISTHGFATSEWVAQ